MKATIATLRTVGRAAVALRSRPDLWVTALRSYRSLVPARWWRSRPHLPVPDPTWLRFRLVTAYGGNATPTTVRVEDKDLILWLEWRRAWPS